MKKIIGIIIASMMFANIGLAEMRIIENMDRTYKKNEFVPNFITVCIDNYKFVLSERAKVLYNTNSTAVTMSMVQFFEERDGKSLPAKC